jgi:hypothetical protein
VYKITIAGQLGGINSYVGTSDLHRIACVILFEGVKLYGTPKGYD